ncbi:MAG: DUF305 domain-containing protein [bacterium]|nr:DUF305 domain-containing protein [bacterium]
MHQSQYKKLVPMVILSFIAMYFLMFAMVNSMSNIFIGVNQFYMAGLMTAPMIIIELLVMSGMYMNKKLNVIIIALSIVFGLSFFMLIRNQTAIGDGEFLKSMIPHHAGAILMCEKAKLQDAEIKKLCNGIISGQQNEIDFMKNKLNQ